MSKNMVTSTSRTESQVSDSHTSFSIETLLKNDLELLFAEPYLLDKPSAWFGHVPFAHWLVSAVRPQVLVELGTHAGVSYSAFCSTVINEKTSTKCFAVDTWAGDEHSGLYSSQIYNDLKAFNDEHYSHFSTLLRCTFDQALEQFEDNSIDVLHIDGFHTYDAVSHDFNSWRPKLSDKAVVLFHDTNERRQDFGVWRFWGELSERYPSFEFLHSHGLGVLAVGKHVPPAISELCAIKSEEKIVALRNRFMMIGSLWETKSKAIKENKAHREQLNQIQIDTAKKISEKEKEIQDTRTRSAKIIKRLQESAATQLLNKEAAATQALNQETEIKNLKNRIIAAENRALTSEIEYRSIIFSRSWRITRPLRKLANYIPKPIKKKIRNTANIVKSIKDPKNFLVYFRSQKIYESLSNSDLFDKDWYLSQYPDVAAAGLDPVRHYIDAGSSELRNPSQQFNTRFYTSSHPDVAASGINPLYHYICYGKYEARESMPPPCTRTTFDTEKSKKWINELRADAASTRVKEKNPLVSIILPTKDRIKVLPNALNSIISQSYENWELLIIDDGSVDGTIEMITANYQDSRIKTLQNEGNGVCAARNHGLKHASGEFIAYLDSDNEWVSEFLELMLYEIERSGADSAYAALKCIETSRSGELPNIFYRAEPFNYEQLKLYNYIDMNIFIHKKELIQRYGKFDETLKRMVDWDLILRYLYNAKTSFAYFIGANYDASPSLDRITNRESISYLNVVRNKHWVNWELINSSLSERDKNLTSVIICVYGQPELTRLCLTSLFTHEAGEIFEVILVDNCSDPETIDELERWAVRMPNIKLIKNPENFNFSLGNNIGFAASRGSKIVFLNNDTEVSPEWLRTLTRPLNNPEIKGTQPKLVYPDGSIQCVGVVFSNRSPIGYPIYQALPSDFAPTQKPRNFSAVTAACVALRADDFAAAHGFDPIYINGQEDIDLCLRIGSGKPVFRYVADSVVVHHEGKSHGRGKNIEHNRRVFYSRWKNLLLHNDTQFYEEDGLTVGDYSPDSSEWVEPGYAVWKPKHIGLSHDTQKLRIQPSGNSTIAIKIGCPRPSLKDHWGDYHFAVALVSAFLKHGIRARIDFLESWDTAAREGDINLVLRGLSRFKPNPTAINLMWMISHPDKISIDEIEEFDHIFVASDIWAKKLSSSSTVSIEPLLQCTDPCRFYPGAFNSQLHSKALFVANSRRILRPIVQQAIAQNVPIDIYGEMWEGLAPAEWIKGEKIDNVDLPSHYASADVVLNDHWDSMRERGFVSNRVFDVLACGTPLVTDSVAGLPSELNSGCSFFDQGVPLLEVLQKAHRAPQQSCIKTNALAELVRREHSFDARASHILKTINGLIDVNYELQ